MRILCTLAMTMFVCTTIVLGPTVPRAAAQGGVELGVLTCKNVPGTGINLFIHSSVATRCVFTHAGGGEERYVGESGIGLGIDVNWHRDETVRFAVISATSDLGPGSYMLAGRYIGGQASATLGFGAGAAVLVGGGQKNITLQPLALATSTGADLATGIGYLYLRPARDNG